MTRWLRRTALLSAPLAAALLAGAGVAQDADPPKTPPPAPVPAPGEIAPPIDPTKQKKNGVNTVLNRTISDIEEKGRKAGKRAVPTDPASKEKVAQDQREALLLFQQAVAAQQAGKTLDALKLANQAKTLFPGNPEIATFAAALKTEVATSRVTGNNSAKARGYLSAGFQRGMDLVKASRFPEAEDMFAGVLDAAKLFPDPGVVETVRRSAEKELNKHRVQVAVAGATDPARRDDVRIAGVGATPPDNAARLLRGGEARVPAWYSLTKQRLSKRLTVDYKRSQVAAVLDDIADETGISIVIDKPVAISRAHTSSLLDLRIG
ncbi:MAG TPA: hypothetical protein VNC50_02290, partial [Planctomycetia bacterium]|nr:hypothetical protein [Planctomycetia bacterium]